MTVGELKKFIEDLGDDMLVVTDQYNSGSGGHFEADASVRNLRWISELNRFDDDGEAADQKVLRISNYR